jgi:dTDP-4-dehydrorhamnose reductase
MLRQLEAGGTIRAVNDRLGTLTSAGDLATALARTARDQLEGTWHVVSPGVVSRYDIAVELARILGRGGSLEPVSHTAFPAPAPRGRSEALCTLRAGTGLFEPEGWRTRLRRYVTALSAGARK